jgi:hypothetical protein
MLLENQTKTDLASQLTRSVLPVRWSWVAVRRKTSEPWSLASFAARTTNASSTSIDNLDYGRLLVFSEAVDADVAAQRIEDLDLGPTGRDLGLSLRLAGRVSQGYRIPSGSTLGIGPVSAWPEYYINWPLDADNDLRWAISLWDPVSAPGITAFKHGYEPVFSKLYGIRYKPIGSADVPMTASVRVVYPYRIGDVWHKSSGLIAYVDWLGRGEPKAHSLQISMRQTNSDPDPETRTSLTAGATTAVAVSCDTPPAEADLFLIEPGSGDIWDTRTWMPEKPGLPVTIVPDVEEEAEAKIVAIIPPSDSIEKITSDSDFAQLLRGRWEETQRCLGAGANLAATVMAGSLLEGGILAVALTHQPAALSATKAPRGRSGASVPLHGWHLVDLIEVARELQWLGQGLSRFTDVVRVLRNAVHPWEEHQSGEVDADTAIICFQVVQQALAQLAKAAQAK